MLEFLSTDEHCNPADGDELSLVDWTCLGGDSRGGGAGAGGLKALFVQKCLIHGSLASVSLYRVHKHTRSVIRHNI